MYLQIYYKNLVLIMIVHLQCMISGFQTFPIINTIHVLLIFMFIEIFHFPVWNTCMHCLFRHVRIYLQTFINNVLITCFCVNQERETNFRRISQKICAIYCYIILWKEKLHRLLQNFKINGPFAKWYPVLKQ